VKAYYNDSDRYCCDWLSNLMDAGLIMAGWIDDRWIADVRPDDVRGCTRAHWFAGIAGWDLALQLAGWPDTRPVWTGSCPCQPFSIAGQGKGGADERHLWPHRLRAYGNAIVPQVAAQFIKAVM
jgi:DNA (cytosine-5)-methyltransferase 1